MDLKSMKIKSEDREDMMGSPIDPSKMEYPYGLKIYLDDGSIENLGLSSLPAVGTELKLEAVVKVCCVAQNESEDGGADSRIELQITDMALSSAPKSESEIAQKLYGE